MRQLDEVADGIWVTTSRRMATTSTVIVGGEEALLVDPAWDAAELDALAATLGVRNLHVRAGLRPTPITTICCGTRRSGTSRGGPPTTRPRSPSRSARTWSQR